MKTVEQLPQPRSAFSARNAPAAGFMSVEMHDPSRQVNHAGLFVNDYRAAGAQHRADFRHRVVIHRHINFISRKQRTGTSAGYHRLQLLAVLHAAGYFLNHALQIKAERQLVNSGLIDVPGNRIEPRPAIFRRSQRSVPIATLPNYRGHGAERFNVIDHSGTAVESDGGREWRFDSRIASLAFERFHQGRFFAAFIRARARMPGKLEVESAA